MADLRFPIGEFVFPEAVSSAERAAHIEAIRTLPEQLRRAIAGLPEDKFAVPYRPGGWTTRQVVHHLADSHMNCYIRFKLALTEDTPTIKPYDEAAWAELPGGDDAPLVDSLAIVDAVHARWVYLLERMTEEDWARAFRHPALCEVKLFGALAMYAWHGAHHVAHISALRERENF